VAFIRFLYDSDKGTDFLLLEESAKLLIDTTLIETFASVYIGEKGNYFWHIVVNSSLQEFDN
jgi:hypothetical protein